MRKSKSTTQQLDGKASKEVFKMGGGNAALALGVDFRHEDVDDKAVNADYGNGLNIGGEGTIPPTNASRNVYALYGELSLPVIKDLELTAAVRYDHYSDVGSNTSPRCRRAGIRPRRCCCALRPARASAHRPSGTCTARLPSATPPTR